MNIPLERLIEGIVATLRTDVIPKVADGYARGQAVGVIDLLNNIGPRIEWARGPTLDAVSEKIELIGKVGELLPELSLPAVRGSIASMSSAELLAERDRLDAGIGDLFARIHELEGVAGASGAALALLKQHIHGELAREMKLTRKPLFAEIASGGEGKTTK